MTQVHGATVRSRAQGRNLALGSLCGPAQAIQKDFRHADLLTTSRMSQRWLGPCPSLENHTHGALLPEWRVNTHRDGGAHSTRPLAWGGRVAPRPCPLAAQKALQKHCSGPRATGWLTYSARSQQGPVQRLPWHILEGGAWACLPASISLLSRSQTTGRAARQCPVPVHCRGRWVGNKLPLLQSHPLLPQNQSSLA